MIERNLQDIFSLEFMTKKYLKKKFEKYKSKNKFKFEETYLKQFLNILKKTKKDK